MTLCLIIAVVSFAYVTDLNRTSIISTSDAGDLMSVEYISSPFEEIRTKVETTSGFYLLRSAPSVLKGPLTLELRKNGESYLCDENRMCNLLLQ